ncbi:cadherin-23-like [Ascaphus truei]|uniref:cadherin-23-like n=1 Tax=Ascaphus truei TaxID=8439 RepID=UPI003F5A7AE8
MSYYPMEIHLEELLLLLFSCFAVQQLNAHQNTTVRCDQPSITELGVLDDGYQGDIEWISNIPSDVTLELQGDPLTSNLDYVEFIYDAGSNNATVRTKKPLDADELEVGELRYVINCLGNNNTRRQMLKDKNDNAPVFVQHSYSLLLLETTEVYSTILKVEAIDKDVSPHFKMITYSLSGLNADYFQIKPSDGVITLAKVLEFCKLNNYTLTVKAEDPNGKYSTVPLLIDIKDVDTMNPHFIHPLYKTSILENHSGNLSTLPEEIKAIDGDVGINEPIYYSINNVYPSEYRRVLSINHHDGVISLNSTLDRETISLITVEIKATQQDNDFKSTDTVVLISILDENDNPPQFSLPLYESCLPENSPAGSTVLMVTATDKDEGGFNGHFTIVLEGSPFQISDLGIITVKNDSVLDRERTKSINFQVKATDKLPPHFETLTTVNITLLDQNDNSPVFDRIPYVGHIFSNMTVGMTVIKVIADDADEGTNGNISFTLEGDIEHNYFDINEISGEINLKEIVCLPHNQHERFHLSVTATDGGSCSTTTSVQIFAHGYSKPQFVQKTYTSTIEEKDSPVLVTQVQFVPLNPAFPVTLTLLTEAATFLILNNGAIWTKDKLDYETRTSYMIHVSLTDGNTTDYATVYVNVTDINDNSPAFHVNNTTIHILENVGVINVVVNVTDADDGFNGLISYSSEGGDGRIDIDPVKGSIFIKKPLDREEKALYNFTVIARDQGHPPLFSEVTFSIIVDDMNDNAPTFPLSKYEVTVPETETIGTTLLTVSAIDMDSGINTLLSYKVISQQPHTTSLFGIDSATGQISLLQQLDYETEKYVEIEIQASDGGSPRLNSTTTVEIHVLDVNDNPPEFSQSVYNVSVQENLANGGIICALGVTDKDERGFNGKLEITPKDSPFHISDTGLITVTNSSALDREQTKCFLLQVSATENVPPYFETQATVNISLVDENDNSPVFVGTPYEGHIFSNMTTGTTVLKVIADDADEGANGDIQFTLEGGRENDYFEINNVSGVIILKKKVYFPLDRMKHFNLLVTATDGGYSPRMTSVLVQIVRHEGSRLQFIHHAYTASVEEEKDSPVLVTKVEFVPLNPAVPVTLTLLTEAATFSIYNNGAIWTKDKLDYETCTSYMIHVSLTDGNTTDNATVYVNVTDINDNSPAFHVNNTTIHVLENVGVINVVVNVTDADDKFSGLISYGSEGGDGKIDIDPVKGSIFLEKTLDREEKALYNFTVIARDQGQPPLFSEVTFTIIVDDMNDNAPTFPLSKYEVTVPENETIGTVLLTVSAIDMDSGTNALITYTVTNQQPPTATVVFRIDSSTGEITLLQQLDSETGKYFEIEVQASDGGSPSLNCTATIGIYVLDVNDNPPEFNQTVYNISVEENLPTGGIICVLNVTDRDEGGLSNGYFRTNDTMFSVDGLGGMYLVNGELDRESTPEIVVRVWAFDAHSNGLNSSALVVLKLIDDNDNNPEFHNRPVVFTIPEGDYSSSPPVPFGEINATDLDEGLNGQITFHSSSIDGDNSFIIQQNGMILAHGLLDREAKNRYTRAVTASDNGTPPRKNFADVTIVILDVNDNAPAFTEHEYLANIILANVREGDPVLTVSATDPDTGNNSLISYSFPHHYDGFTINGSNGQISLSRNLSDVTEETGFALVVIASDDGVPALSSSVTVYITMRANDTDFGLQFANSHYSFSILEEAPEGTEVGAVRALTGSADIAVTYLLKSYTGTFSITNEGHIITHAILDREEQNSYSIMVEATDSRKPSNTAATVVAIRVDDVNDNAPVFSPLIHTNLTCLEDEDIVNFGLITATDSDTGNNSFVRYFLENDFDSFHINTFTGNLTTTRALDREAVASYELKVIATDSGFPPLSSSVFLHITVGDVNDNRPIFKKRSFNITVKENEPPRVILDVSAVDEDIGYNALIFYSFTKASPLFYIGEMSGNISVLQPLDFEMTTQHIMEVIAYNPDDPQLQSTATVTVNVEDVNDEGPIFESPTYNKIIQDSTSSLGSLVLDINATDERKAVDKGINYAITDGDSEGLFVISNATGHIFLIKDLPKHNTSVYYVLTVTATDTGVPPLSASVKVFVTIAPGNIGRPVFSAARYSPDPMSDQALPATFLIQINALYTTSLVYSIASGNDKDYFTMDPLRGIIRTKKMLKKEDFPMDLTVHAADSMKPDIFSEATVHVTVKEDNHFAPVFPNPLVEATLKEEQAFPTFIAQLQAYDSDTGRNGLLTYSILNGNAGKFSINAVNGKLYAETSFDFEEGPIEYQMVVLSEDDGVLEKKQGYCTVVVYIADINDCKPVFEPVENMLAEENAPIGTVVGKVTATDKDSEDNAFILYSLIDEDDQFEIDGLLGNIWVKNPLDYETKNKSVLTVRATNNKTAPFYQTSTPVTVHILDVNDNAPEFTQTQYFAEPTMDSPLGTVVVVVNATDRDQGDNGLVEYYLLPDPMSTKYFLIENVRDGKIITVENHLKPTEMNLTVLAKDRGFPSLNSTALVVVNVLNKPQSSVPEFIPNEISTSIKENSGGKRLVYTFAAKDARGKNINYRIVDGNKLDHFILDAKTGQLWTTDNLNYEMQPTYTIIVEANETPDTRLLGQLPKNMARLKIHVQDVNEAPVFDKQLYVARILNSVPYKFPVIRVEAKDPDLGDNGSLAYSLVNQSGEEFDIDKYTGQIFVVSVARKTGTFSFKAQATDRGGIFAQTNIQVTVDASSSDDAVVMTVNQTLDTIAHILPEITRILEDVLQQNVTIIELFSNATKIQSRNNGDRTSIKFNAFDENNQVVHAAEVERKLTYSMPSIQKRLQEILQTPVDISVSQPLKSFMGMNQGTIAGIALAALLAGALLGLIVYFCQRKMSQNWSVGKSNVFPEMIENLLAKDYKNGGPDDVEKGKQTHSAGFSAGECQNKMQVMGGRQEEVGQSVVMKDESKQMPAIPVKSGTQERPEHQVAGERQEPIDPSRQMPGIPVINGTQERPEHQVAGERQEHIDPSHITGINAGKSETEKEHGNQEKAVEENADQSTAMLDESRQMPGIPVISGTQEHPEHQMAGERQEHIDPSHITGINAPKSETEEEHGNQEKAVEENADQSTAMLDGSRQMPGIPVIIGTQEGPEHQVAGERQEHIDPSHITAINAGKRETEEEYGNQEKAVEENADQSTAVLDESRQMPGIPVISGTQEHPEHQVAGERQEHIDPSHITGISAPKSETEEEHGNQEKAVEENADQSTAMLDGSRQMPGIPVISETQEGPEHQVAGERQEHIDPSHITGINAGKSETEEEHGNQEKAGGKHADQSTAMLNKSKQMAGTTGVKSRRQVRPEHQLAGERQERIDPSKQMAGTTVVKSGTQVRPEHQVAGESHITGIIAGESETEEEHGNQETAGGKHADQSTAMLKKSKKVSGTTVVRSRRQVAGERQEHRDPSQITGIIAGQSETEEEHGNQETTRGKHADQSTAMLNKSRKITKTTVKSGTKEHREHQVAGESHITGIIAGQSETEEEHGNQETAGGKHADQSTAMLNKRKITKTTVKSGTKERREHQVAGESRKISGTSVVKSGTKEHREHQVAGERGTHMAGPGDIATGTYSDVETITVTEEETPEVETITVTEEETPEVETITVTEEETPEVETVTVTEEETPEVETITVTEEETPAVETVTVTEEETPEVETVTVTEEETSEVETVTVTEEETSEVETTTLIKKETPAVETTTVIKKETPAVETTTVIKEETPAVETTTVTEGTPEVVEETVEEFVETWESYESEDSETTNIEANSQPGSQAEDKGPPKQDKDIK